MTDKELALMHNVAGEIKGSEAAMQYAVDHNIPEITIYHDYEGIAKWCTGAWKATKPGTIAYQAILPGRQKKRYTSNFGRSKVILTTNTTIWLTSLPKKLSESCSGSGSFCNLCAAYILSELSYCSQYSEY